MVLGDKFDQKCLKSEFEKSGRFVIFWTRFCEILTEK
jgi:hypothetical protein